MQGVGPGRQGGGRVGGTGRTAVIREQRARARSWQSDILQEPRPVGLAAPGDSQGDTWAESDLGFRELLKSPSTEFPPPPVGVRDPQFPLKLLIPSMVLRGPERAYKMKFKVHCSKELLANLTSWDRGLLGTPFTPHPCSPNYSGTKFTGNNASSLLSKVTTGPRTAGVLAITVCRAWAEGCFSEAVTGLLGATQTLPGCLPHCDHRRRPCQRPTAGPGALSGPRSAAAGHPHLHTVLIYG